MMNETLKKLISEFGNELMSDNKIESAVKYEQLKSIFDRVNQDKEYNDIVMCTYMSKVINELLSKGIIVDVYGKGFVYQMSDGMLNNYEHTSEVYCDMIVLDSRIVKYIEIVIVKGNVFDEYMECLNVGY